jgi:hypothetical protein
VAASLRWVAVILATRCCCGISLVPIARCEDDAASLPIRNDVWNSSPYRSCRAPRSHGEGAVAGLSREAAGYFAFFVDV